MSALAGAFFGAFAASRLQSKKESKSRLIDQLNACNACASYSNAVFIAALGFKEQLSKPLVDEYQHDRKRFIDHLEKSGDKHEPFHVEFNFGKINMFQHAAETVVENIAFRTGASGNTVLAASFLRQCLHALEQALIWHDESKDRIIRHKDEHDNRHNACLYFGVPIDEQLCLAPKFRATDLGFL